MCMDGQDEAASNPPPRHLRTGSKVDKALPAMPEKRGGDRVDPEEDDIAAHYIRDPPSPPLPPTPISPPSLPRPRAPTPSASRHPHFMDPSSPVSPASPALSTSPLHSQMPQFSSHSPLLRSVSASESTLMPDSQPQTRSFARPAKSSLPDPSHFPDPYPFRPPHHYLASTAPALSSAGSSSASTRSSAYTSSGSAIASVDYSHVHVASGEDDTLAGVGINSEAVNQLLSKTPITSPSSRGPPSHMPIDQLRWSGAYSSSGRSRSSSTGGASNENAVPVPALREQPSYDRSWQTFDEKDEVQASEDDTDYEHGLDDDENEEEEEEERTSAAIIAEEGRGLIVQGEGMQMSDIQVQPGTTHLLIGSSTTPNVMPAFLSGIIPKTCNSLLALDISANFLGALPPCLAMCSQLEELNIASNPLRVLPAFLSQLRHLQVLIADCTGIISLPDCLVDLDRLHTISIRRNKLHSLPSWLCLLPALQTLCVDGNPFQGPWKALVEPLLAKVPMTPMYPPSTPSFPLLSAGLRSSQASTDVDDADDSSDPPSPGVSGHHNGSPDDEPTITPDRVPFLGRGAQTSLPSPPPPPPRSKPLQRTRTTPNRAFHEQNRSKSVAPLVETAVAGPSSGDVGGDAAKFGGDRELRKMKSAGDLRRVKALGPSTPDLTVTTPPRLTPPQAGSSHSSSALPNTSPPISERSGMTKRFASLGPSSAMGSPSRPSTGTRTALTQSLWDGPSLQDVAPTTLSNRNTVAGDDDVPPMKLINPHPVLDHGRPPSRPQTTTPVDTSKDVKERGSRWGFLKKMSMGKIKPDVPSRPSTSQGRPPMSRPYTPSHSRMSTSPRIDVRLSTTGALDAFEPPITPSSPIPSSQGPSKQPSPERLQAPSNLLVPSSPSPMSRSSKRRSFLPLDSPAPLQIPIPDASPFIQGVKVSNEGDDERRNATPSPVDVEQQLRREEERAKEAYMRALRSVMAYLRDMNDLGLSQQPQNPLSMYGGPSEEALSSARSRRLTVSEGSREMSIVSGSSDSPSHLRSAESIAGLRSGSASQTMSVATDSSAGSADDRKFKDDKGKRAMIIREIVATERTYVKGLEELMDIYIKPASVQANLLTGVGSSKDTVVPLAERKIVFNGIDALYSFHKDSFLPSLEMAADPLVRPSAGLQVVDADGQLSLTVAKAVGNMFLKHAAFMKMYSSYINNFDNSVHRVKYWTSDRNPSNNPSPGGTLSPSSSAVQLAGVGLAMAITNPVVAPDSAALAAPNLTTSQRKRIRSYLKRCRVHPRHSQLNLEGYLLLPVQRIPRYRLLLEELLRSTPPTLDYIDDPLDRALAEISSLANNMNEGKREAESRRKLVQWQARIRGKFPSPLVQPHRRLIMDGKLLLTRVVRKTAVDFEAINPQGDATLVKVDCLAPELTPRPLIGILCNDLLVLCRDPSDGLDPMSPVDLWAVLRMQTLPQPASIVHGNVLRLVDNKAILYFDAPSPSDALNWYRAINLHIPASKT